jgi:hypothetical protein
MDKKNRNRLKKVKKVVKPIPKLPRGVRDVISRVVSEEFDDLSQRVYNLEDQVKVLYDVSHANAVAAGATEEKVENPDPPIKDSEPEVGNGG